MNVLKILTGVTFIIILAGTAIAQYPEVAFVHGLDGTEGTWSETADILTNQRVYIAPTNTAYDSHPTISDIASSYYPNLADNSIVVGYSIGGLVGRKMYYDPASRNKIGALITIGTPHLGARAANTVNSDDLYAMVRAWIHQLSLGPAKSFGALGSIDRSFGVSYAANVISGIMEGFFNIYVDDWTNDRPVIDDIREGSPWLYGLNLYETMTGGTMPSARYALYGTESYDSHNAHVRLAQSAVTDDIENGEWYANAYRIYCYYNYISWCCFELYQENMDLYYHSGGDPDYWIRAQLYLDLWGSWSIGAENLRVMQDFQWSLLNGSVRDDGNGGNDWLDNDGLLSTFTQAPPAYPGLPGFFTEDQRIRVPDVNHIEETLPHPEVLEKITFALSRFDIGVVARTP